MLEAEGPPGAPTLLLLHGWTATAALNWFTALPALGERYRVVAMDVRGHGRGLRRPFTLRACADDAAALCRVLDLPPVIAVGYSMGGPLAQLLWRHHPERVGGLVLCATSTHFSHPHPLDPALDLAYRGMALGLAFLPPAAQREVGRRVLVNRVPPGEFSAWALEERERNDLSAVVAAGAALRRYDARGWIGTVDVPTSVVVTTDDKLVAPGRQLAMAAAIGGATTWRVAADHPACVTAHRLFVPALLGAVADVIERASEPEDARDSA